MAKKQQKNELLVRKSNVLISSKYTSSLLENKILSFGLSRIYVESERAKSVITAPELRKIFGLDDDENLYKKLKQIGKTMRGHTIVLEDGKDFKVTGIVDNVEYKNGEMVIVYNDDMKPHIMGLQNNYTTMELSLLSEITHNCTYRIYELFKSVEYKIDPGDYESYVSMTYGLSEFRCMIGLVDMDDEKVKAAIAKGASWDDIYYNVAAGSSKYKKWYEFRRNILDTAQKEFENQLDIRFEYEPERRGRGGEVTRVTFKIYRNIPIMNNEENIAEKVKYIRKKNESYVQMSLFEVSSVLNPYIGVNGLTPDDLELFLKDAEGDANKVKEAIDYTNARPAMVKNYVGYIRKLIRQGIEEPISVLGGSMEKAEAYIDYVESDRSSQADVAWEHVKQRADYKDFVYFVELTFDCTMEEFISERTSKEIMDIYGDYKVGRQIEKPKRSKKAVSQKKDIVKEQENETIIEVEAKDIREVEKQKPEVAAAGPVDQLLGDDFYLLSWNNIKKKEEFALFEKWCASYAMTVEEFEELKTPKERVSLYMSLKGNNFAS